MKKAILGKSGQSNVSIDIEALLASRLLVTAQSGGGKSWLLRRIAEQTAGQVQQIIIDPEGEFYTLREKHPYIVAGKEGDCPAHPRSAAVLARHLLELQASAILDIYELTPQERKSFVREFLMSMINAPKKLWRPVLIFLDEAHEFAPQKAPSEASAAVAALMTRGRKRGFCGVLATQRISSLDKDAVAQVGNKLIGKATLDLDVKRSLEELGLGKGDAAELRRFGPGEFWAYGPAFSIAEGIAKIGVGPVETTHPRPGIAVPPVPPAQEEITKALAGLAELDLEAEEQERTIEGLEKQVAELKRELRSKQFARQDVEQAIEDAKADAERQRLVARDEGFRAGSAEALRAAIAALESQLSGIDSEANRRLDRKEATLSKPSEIIPKDIPAVPQQARISQAGGGGRIARPSPGLEITKSQNSANGDLPSPTSGGGRMIAELVARYPIKLTKAQAATLAGVKPTTGTFSNQISRLRTGGYITVEGGFLQATEKAIEAFGSNVPQPKTPEETRESWKRAVGGQPAKMIDLLNEAYPGGMTRQAIAAELGVLHTTGTFSNSISKLNANGLIVKDGDKLYLSEDLI